MGSTSAGKRALFGETEKYRALLVPVAERLIRQYPQPEFVDPWRSLPDRSISIAPMLLCDALVSDLGGRVSETVLTAIGACCFHISTHDDVVDEMPGDRSMVAALTYSGTIALIEGLRLLRQVGAPRVEDAMLEQIARNHELQQQCVRLLWAKRPSSFAEYHRGIAHDAVFAAIGLRTGLAVVNRPDLVARIEAMAEGYGTAFQLLDDIAEVREDARHGYASYPIVEGAPYAVSLQEVSRALDRAVAACDPSWTWMEKLLEYPRQFASRFGHGRP